MKDGKNQSWDGSAFVDARIVASGGWDHTEKGFGLML